MVKSLSIICASQSQASQGLGPCMAARGVIVTTSDRSYELRKQNVVIVTWKNFISNITTWYDQQLL